MKYEKTQADIEKLLTARIKSLEAEIEAFRQPDRTPLSESIDRQLWNGLHTQVSELEMALIIIGDDRPMDILMRTNYCMGVW